MVDEAMVRRADRLLALPAAPEPPAAVAGDAQRRRAVLRRDRARSDVHRARGDADRGPRCAASGDRRRPPAARARRRPVRGGHRARRACSRTRCWCATSRSGSRPLRACASWATSSIAGSARDRCRSARRCARPPRSSPGGRRRDGRGIVALRVRRSTARASRCWTSTARHCCPPRERGGHRRRRRRSRRRRRRGGRCRGTGPRRVGPRAAARRAAGPAVRRTAGGGRGRRRGGRDRDRARPSWRACRSTWHTRTPTPARARTAGAWSTAGTSSASPRRTSRACCPTWRRSWPGSRATTSARPSRETRLHSRVAITACEPLADGGLVHLRVRRPPRGDDERARDVLDWRLVGLMP